MTPLTTERLILRRPEPRDIEAMAAFFRSDRARYVGGPFEPHPAWRHVAHIFGHWDIKGYGLWAVDESETDRLIGLVGPYNPDGWPEAEIGWMLFDGFEGKGYAREAAVAAIAHAREVLGWTEIVHYIAHGNDQSVVLAQRLGAVADPAAPLPYPARPCHVYRQPAPERSA